MTFLKKILLVDREPRVVAALRGALESTGKYVIKEEHDSRQAVNAARWFRPDLIMVDDTIVRSASGDVVQQLQADPASADTPVVFVTPSTSGDGGVVSGGILSGYSFLANPVRTEEAVRYVAELLSPSAK